MVINPHPQHTHTHKSYMTAEAYVDISETKCFDIFYAWNTKKGYKIYFFFHI